MTNREKFQTEDQFQVNGKTFEHLPNGIKNLETGQIFIGHVDSYTTALGIEIWMNNYPTRKEFKD